MRRFRGVLWSQLAQRRGVVDDGDAAAVSTDDEVVSPRMNLEIVHARARRDIAEADPMHARIEGRERAKVRAGVEQLPIHRIVAHEFDRVVRRKNAHGRLPVSPKSDSAKYRRSIVAGAI